MTGSDCSKQYGDLLQMSCNSPKELIHRIRLLERQIAICKEREESGITLADNFRRLAERSREAIYHYDIAGRRFAFYNSRFHELFREEGHHILTPKNVLMHIHPEDLPKVKAAKEKSLHSAAAVGEAEYRFLLPTRQQVRWMHDRWIVTRNSQGRPKAIEGFIRDNTRRKRAKEELELARHNSLIGTYIVQKGKIKYVNPAFMRITQYAESELLDMSSLQIVHDDDKDHVRRSAIRMLKKEDFEPYEFRILNKSGRMNWIMETVTPVHHHARRAVLGNFMDISQKKIAEEHRMEKDRLQGVLEMAGAVCHELTNPMQVILTACHQLSRQRFDLDSRQSELYKLIEKSIERMSKTTHNLNHITKYATKNYVRGKKIIDIPEATGRKKADGDLP